MQKNLNVFNWDQALNLDRSDRHSRQRAPDVTGQVAAVADRDTSAAAWALMREAPRSRDQVLSPLAIAWLAGFPEASRPSHLCDNHPRIANRLALSWKDRTLVKLILDNLLTDRRGGRQGFPPDVAEELRVLRREASRSEGSAV